MVVRIDPVLVLVLHDYKGMIQEVLKEYGPKGVQALKDYSPNKTGDTDQSISFEVNKNQLVLKAGGFYNRRYRRMNGPTSSHTDTYKEATKEFVEELEEAVKTDFIDSMRSEVLSVWR